MFNKKITYFELIITTFLYICVSTLISFIGIPIAFLISLITVFVNINGSLIFFTICFLIPLIISLICLSLMERFLKIKSIFIYKMLISILSTIMSFILLILLQTILQYLTKSHLYLILFSVLLPF